MLARLLDLCPLLEQLQAAAASPLTAETLAVRQQILARIVEASFEIDSVVSEIQNEEVSLQEIWTELQSERDEQVTLLTLGAGLLAIGSAAGTGLTLVRSTTAAGEWVGAISGALGGVLSIAAVLVPTARRPPLRIPAGLLAPILDPALGPKPYPPLVWQYLLTPDVGHLGVAPRQQLIAQWQLLGRVDAHDLSRSVEDFARPITTFKDVSLDEINNRSLMLGDLRATIALMKSALALVWSEVTGRSAAQDVLQCGP